MTNTKGKQETFVEVRYGLLDCLMTAVRYNLTIDEYFSLLFTECNFKETSGREKLLVVFLSKLHYHMGLELK